MTHTELIYEWRPCPCGGKRHCTDCKGHGGGMVAIREEEWPVDEDGFATGEEPRVLWEAT